MMRADCHRQAARPRLARRPSFEVFEPRRLLAPVPPVAAFDFAMADRFGLDANGDGRIDLPNTTDYVYPASGRFSVTFNGLLSAGVLPALTQFNWTFTGNGETITRTGPMPVVALRQGTYTVRLDVANPSVPNVLAAGTSSFTNDVPIRDILVVSLGDSYAAGEGSPEVPSGDRDKAQWAHSTTNSALDEENRNAHRSTLSGPAQAALALEQADPHTSVTFVGLAQSGATIGAGILGSKKGSEELENPLDDNSSRFTLMPQLNEATAILAPPPGVAPRVVDALTISDGGNDVGFSAIIRDLLVHGSDLPSQFQKTIPQIETQFLSGSPTDSTVIGLNFLPAAYAALNAKIHQLLLVRDIFLTEYPDPLRDGNGNFPAELGSDLSQAVTNGGLLASAAGFFLAGPLGVIPGAAIAAAGSTIKVDRDEMLFAEDHIFRPLDATLKAIVDQNNVTADVANDRDVWHLVKVSDLFRTHGYAAPDHWFNHITDSFSQVEGSFDGSVHPNPAGYRLGYAPRIASAVALTADPGGPYNALVAGRPNTLTAAGSVSRLGAIVKYEWDLDRNFDRASVTQALQGFDTIPASVITRAVNALPAGSALNTSDIVTEVFLAFTALGISAPTTPFILTTYLDRFLEQSLPFDVDAVGVTASYTPDGSGTRTLALRVTNSLGMTDVRVFRAAATLPAPGSTIISGLRPPLSLVGNDTLVINGTDSADTIRVSFAPNPSSPFLAQLVVDQTGQPSQSFLSNSIARIVINGFGGADLIIVFPDVPQRATISGGPGADTIFGSPRNDTLDGGDGNDYLDGRSGADLILGGRGDDLATADPADIVDLGADEDGLIFRGTAGADDIRVFRVFAADGPHAVFVRNGRTFDVRYSHGETITVLGGRGNDRIVMDPSAATRWKARFFGGPGDDRLVGGPLDDLLAGGPGRNRLFGKGGHDRVTGGRDLTALGSLNPSLRASRETQRTPRLSSRPAAPRPHPGTGSVLNGAPIRRRMARLAPL